MITETTSTVNSSSVSDSQELPLTSYKVFTTPHGRIEVNMKLRKKNQLLIVHRTEDLDQLREAELDLSEGHHGDTKHAIIAFREADGRLTFLGVRGSAPIPPLASGEECTARLMAFMNGDYCGTPTLRMKVMGESRMAEAAGAPTLAAIRKLGLGFDEHPREKWVYVPPGFTVRYIAPKTGPQLQFIALEVDSTPAAPSTPTDAAPALLPAWAQSVSEQMIAHHEQYIHEVVTIYPSSFFAVRTMAGVPVHEDEEDDPIPDEEDEIADRPAPKTRRYARRLRAWVVGETTYKYTSERLVQLPRSERHKLMQSMDWLLDNKIIPYLQEATDLGALREAFDLTEGRLKVMKGVVTQARKAEQAAKGGPTTAQLADSVHNGMSAYEKQAADIFLDREQKLQQILKDWLGLDLPVVGGVATLKKDAATVNFSLSGYIATPSLQITLSSNLLTRHLRGSIYMHERATDVYLRLWADYDKAVKQAEAHAARRDDRKERRAKPFPYGRPIYAQQ